MLLLIATILGVQNTGTAQTSNCEVKVRCSRLDSAATLIEKGKVCEKQLDLYRQLEFSYQKLTKLYQEENDSLKNAIVIKNSHLILNIRLIENQDKKIKRKNKKLIGSIGLNALLLLLLL